jgi:hypothetical protein
MTPDPQEVVTVYSGPLVVVEAYKQALADAGIDSKMTGDSLLASFGSAIPSAIELFVHQSDLEKAVATIQRYEAERTNGEAGGQDRHHPRDESAPDTVRHHQPRHIPPHQTGH